MKSFYEKYLEIKMSQIYEITDIVWRIAYLQLFGYSVTDAIVLTAGWTKQHIKVLEMSTKHFSVSLPKITL